MLNARYAGATEEFSTLLRFNLAGIPAGATIQAAQLSLTVTNSPASWLDLDVFQVYGPWTESAVTWNLAQSGASWATGGCNGAGTDRAANPAASARIQQTAGGTVTINLPASLIAGWLTDPGSNQGVLLRPKLNSGGAILTYTFGSSEHGTASYRPKLTVSYTTPTGRLSPDTAARLAALPVGLAQPARWQSNPPVAPSVTSVPTGQTWRSYYFLGGQRIALRERTGSAAGVVHYLLTDQLGSTAVTASDTGALEARQWYYPFGGPRANVNNLPTDRRFTGQRSEEATLGSLYDFVARPYSPALGRFLAPDSIVPEPGNPQALNRYSYVYNRPTVAVDPDGHFAWFVTGAIGAAGGAIFSVGQQVVSGMYSGLSVSEAFSQVDGRKVATAAVVGGVAGLTMGAGTVLLGSGLLATGVSGATAGILGGGTERLANASWGEYDRWRAGQSIELQRAWDDAVQHGLLDPKSIAVDAGTGAVSAYVGAGLGKLLQKAGVNTLETMDWSGATTSKPTPSLQLLPNGTAYLKYGRETLYLPQDILTRLANAVTAGSIALIQDLLSQAASEGAKPALQQTLP